MDEQLRTLSSVAAGSVVTVRRLDDQDCSLSRLRELGIDQGRRLRIVRHGDPLICQVGECRFGLCRRLARCIYVDECA